MPRLPSCVRPRACRLVAAAWVALSGLLLAGVALAEGDAAGLVVATQDGGALNLRAAPSADAAVLARLAQGTALRSLGCEEAGGRRWCRVAMPGDPGLEGWAAEEFLVAAPAASEGTALGGPISPGEQACLAAVAAETANPEVVLLGSDEAGADTLVQVGVGPGLAPWQCIAAADGTTRGIQFLGQDGGDVAVAPFDDNPGAAAETACVAAVAAAAASANVTPLAVIPDGGTTVVRLVVGTGDAPWTCSVGPDGAAFDVKPLDGG